MSDPISGASSFSVKTTADGKPVVSTVRDGIDPLDIAEKLKQATIDAKQPTQDKIDSGTKKITELGRLKEVVTAFQKVNSELVNKNSYFKTNIFQNLKPVMKPVNGIFAENYLEVTSQYSNKIFDKTYDIQVDQIAKRDNIKSTKTFSDTTTALNFSDSITINYRDDSANTARKIIMIDATDSLDDIVTKINAQKSTTKVEASIAMLSEGNYSLKLSAQNLAEPIDLSATHANHFGPNGLGLPTSANYMDDPLLVAIKKSDLQAVITVDGTQYIRDTNTNISDIMKGVSLNVLGPMPEATQLDFQLDRDAIGAKTNEWITSLNEVKKFLAPHLIEAQPDEPQAEQDKHLLFGNRLVMQTVDMIHQITQGATGVTVSSASKEFQRFGFDRPEGNLFGGEIKFDAQKLGTMIQDKTLDFVKLMGNYSEISNTDVKILQFPNSLPADIAGVDIALQFDPTGEQNATGRDLFDVTLTFGSKTETVRSSLSQVSFVNAFSGVKLTHAGVPPTIKKNMTVKLTQGIAAKMDSSLSGYLLDKKDSKGILARATHKIISEKNQFKQQIDDTKKRADAVYARTVRAMKSATKRAEQAAQISKMLRALQAAAMKGY